MPGGPRGLRGTVRRRRGNERYCWAANIDGLGSGGDIRHLQDCRSKACQRRKRPRTGAFCRGTQYLHCLFACLGCPAYVTPERTVPLRSVARVLLRQALRIRGDWRLPQPQVPAHLKTTKHQAPSTCLASSAILSRRGRVVAIKCGSGCPSRIQSSHCVNILHAPRCRRVGRNSPDTADSCIITAQ